MNIIRNVSKVLRLALLGGSIWLLGFGAPAMAAGWLTFIMAVLAIAAVAVLIEPIVLQAIGEHGEARFDTRNKSERPD